MPNLLLRAEDTHEDLYAATDLVVDKLERQIRKHKTKVNRKFRQEGAPKHIFAELEQEARERREEEEAEDEIEIVRTKRFNLKPMDSEEAVLQMDMLDHSFFFRKIGKDERKKKRKTKLKSFEQRDLI